MPAALLSTTLSCLLRIISGKKLDPWLIRVVASEMACQVVRFGQPNHYLHFFILKWYREDQLFYQSVNIASFINCSHIWGEV